MWYAGLDASGDAAAFNSSMLTLKGLRMGGMRCCVAVSTAKNVPEALHLDDRRFLQKHVAVFHICIFMYAVVCRTCLAIGH